MIRKYFISTFAKIQIKIMMENKGEILIYQSKQGTTKIDVRLKDETVWLNQTQLAGLLITNYTIDLFTKTIFVYESGIL